MAILKIARAGHPVLLEVAKEVDDPASPEARALVRDMIETLEDAGGIGLAAPQVHASVRVVIFFVPERRTGDDEEDTAEEGAAINGLFGRHFPHRVIGWLSCSTAALSFLVALLAFYNFIQLPGDQRIIAHRLSIIGGGPLAYTSNPLRSG